MLVTNHSNFTKKVCTLRNCAALSNLTMVYWLLVMVRIRMVKHTGSSKTAGAPYGEWKVTCIWHVTRATCAELLHKPAIPLYNYIKYSNTVSMQFIHRLLTP